MTLSGKTRERVMRSFLASLFQSELSTAELEQLAIELSYGTMASDLGNLISDAISTLNRAWTPKLNNGPANLPTSQAYQIIARRRFSKKVVADLMNTASPRLSNRSLTMMTSKTMKEMLDWYFVQSSAEEVNRFLSYIAGDSSDEYLAGIGKK